MKYTAHPQGKRDNLPLISIFNEKGECVATLTMDDIALLYDRFVISLDYYVVGTVYDELVEKLKKQKEKKDESED